MSVRGATVIHLSLSGRSEPLTLSAGKRKRILGIVATDIDRDGDADVVALNEDLHLHVWLNNGQGRFIRRKQAPQRSSVEHPPALHPDQEPVSLYVWSDSHESQTEFALPACAMVLAGCGPPERGSLAFGSSGIAERFLVGVCPRGPPLPALPS
jgi:FG-GAP-like repeat